MSYCKYTRKRKQYTTDGVHWYDYSPQVYEKGSLVQCGLATCTDSPSDPPVTPPEQTTYERWITVDGEYTCVNYNKYYKLRKQTSTDNVNWTNTDEYKTGSLIEANSADCGYIIEDVITWEEVPGEYICESDDNKMLKAYIINDGNYIIQYILNDDI